MIACSEKLRAVLVKPASRFIRVYTVKDGCVIVTGIFERSSVSMTRLQNVATRLTLALVSKPFDFHVIDLDLDESGTGFEAPPPITIGGYATNCRFNDSLALGGYVSK